MIGKSLAGWAAGAVANRTGAPGGGATGALLGAGLAAVTRRMGPTGLVVAALGGLAAKHYLDRRRQAVPRRPIRGL